MLLSLLEFCFNHFKRNIWGRWLRTTNDKPAFLTSMTSVLTAWSPLIYVYNEAKISLPEWNNRSVRWAEAKFPENGIFQFLLQFQYRYDRPDQTHVTVRDTSISVISHILCWFPVSNRITWPGGHEYTIFYNAFKPCHPICTNSLDLIVVKWWSLT